MSIFRNLNKQLEEPAQSHPHRWWHIPLLLALIAGTVYVAYDNQGSSKSTEYQKCEGSIFGTIYHITYRYDKDLKDSIVSALNEVDQSLSPFNPKSIITAVNQNQNPELNHMFMEVFQIAQTISAATGGAFDITVAPLVNAWGFGFKNKENVTPALIDSLLMHVGMEKVRLEGNHLQKSDSLLMLDCSAIAKGYGVDAVGRLLESKGITDYMVEIGGEVRVRGVNPHSTPWNIGINKPDDDSLSVNQEIQEVLHVTNISMATSGNYRNYYQEGDKRYAHTINPHTGYPAQKEILSSTVLTTDCVVADAYATAFMVLGLDSAKAVLIQHPELQAYFIYADSTGQNAVWKSSNLK